MASHSWPAIVVFIVTAKPTQVSDNHNSTQRHNNMAAIKGKDTKPEMIVRRYLWNNGFRYRLNHPSLPGKPDVVLRKYRTCIFVNGCFWHGHDGCRYFVMPKSNVDFWQTKITRNKERDADVQRRLAAMGWHSITIWECELKPSVRNQTLESLAFTLNHLFIENRKPHQYDMTTTDDLSVAAEPSDLV